MTATTLPGLSIVAELTRFKKVLKRIQRHVLLPEGDMMAEEPKKKAVVWESFEAGFTFPTERDYLVIRVSATGQAKNAKVFMKSVVRELGVMAAEMTSAIGVANPLQ